MTTKYKATCDRILCIVPVIATEEMVGSIIVPAAARKALEDKNPIRELRVHSAGPDVKLVKEGDRILYNMHQCNPIPYGDTQLVVISENQVFCVIEQVEEKKPEPAAVPPPPAEPLTVGAIRAALEAKPGLPAEAPPVIAVVQ